MYNLNQLMETILYMKDYAYGRFRNYAQPYISTNFEGTQITKNIFISDLPSTFNLDKLRENKITHILSIVVGFDPVYPNEFKYKNIYARDIQDQDLTQFFDEGNEFIDDCLKNGGRVLVHCSRGISRSATMVLAYLISKGMTYHKAYNYVKSRREQIEPNKGFQIQLLNYHLKKNLKEEENKLEKDGEIIEVFNPIITA